MREVDSIPEYISDKVKSMINDLRPERVAGGEVWETSDVEQSLGILELFTRLHELSGRLGLDQNRWEESTDMYWRARANQALLGNDENRLWDLTRNYAVALVGQGRVDEVLELGAEVFGGRVDKLRHISNEMRDRMRRNSVELIKHHGDWELDLMEARVRNGEDVSELVSPGQVQGLGLNKEFMVLKQKGDVYGMYSLFERLRGMKIDQRYVNEGLLLRRVANRCVEELAEHHLRVDAPETAMSWILYHGEEKFKLNWLAQSLGGYYTEKCEVESLKRLAWYLVAEMGESKGLEVIEEVNILVTLARYFDKLGEGALALGCIEDDGEVWRTEKETWQTNGALFIAERDFKTFGVVEPYVEVLAFYYERGEEELADDIFKEVVEDWDKRGVKDEWHVEVRDRLISGYLMKVAEIHEVQEGEADENYVNQWLREIKSPLLRSRALAKWYLAEFRSGEDGWLTHDWERRMEQILNGKAREEYLYECGALALEKGLFVTWLNILEKMTPRGRARLLGQVLS